MGAPPLFSFLGGSGSGTASRVCIGLFVGIYIVSGYRGDVMRYGALYGVWWLLGGVLLDVVPYSWR